MVPKWVPFPSSIAYHLHEVLRNVTGESGIESGTPDQVRLGASIDGCDLVLLRTSIQFEPEWFNHVCELYQKPVVPVGFCLDHHKYLIMMMTATKNGVLLKSG